LRGRIYRYDPATGRYEKFYEGDRLAGFTFQQDGGMLLFMSGPSVAVLRDGQVSYVIEGIAGKSETRFNDVIADPAGRVFCGTVSNDETKGDQGLGSLYRLNVDGSITRMLDGIGISNGLAFTPDRKGMYYTDTTAGEIYLFDYDSETGDLSNQRVFVDTAGEEGMPDGMTVDTEGYVWSAMWDGSSVIRYAPDGVEERRYRFPALKVSSVAFGGDDYADLYLTSAGGDNREQEGRGAGALFRLRTGARGRPEFFSRVST
jgi:D-xylonolactonase